MEPDSTSYDIVIVVYNFFPVYFLLLMFEIFEITRISNKFFSRKY